MKLIYPAILSSLCLTLAACESVPLGPFGSDRSQTTTPAPAPAPAPSTPAPRTKAPIASGGIDLSGNCNQREIDGFEENAIVSVQGSRVRKLTWRMKIGRKGTCSFNGEDFRQTKVKPSIELVAKDGSGCRLLMWSDPRRITLAHSGCANYCTPKGVYDKAWPVMFDPRTGACAKTR